MARFKRAMAQFKVQRIRIFVGRFEPNLDR
jgi:hypothetical protein